MTAPESATTASICGISVPRWSICATRKQQDQSVDEEAKGEDKDKDKAAGAPGDIEFMAVKTSDVEMNINWIGFDMN